MKGLLLAMLGAGGAFSSAFALLHFAAGADSTADLARFGDAYATVRADYVEPPEDRKLVEGALAGMLSGLDAHSSYFDPRTYAAMQTKTEGQYAGIGIVIGLDGSVVTVVSPIDNTPASKAGIKAGDRILTVDGKPITGQKLDAVQDELRGAPGSKVKLGISRQGLRNPFDVQLTRQAIEVEAVTAKRKGDVGYIKIPAFNERTDSGLRAAVAALKKQIGPKLKGYIVDLRDDGGGLLDQAVAVSDDFLDSGEIVSIRGRDKDETQRFDATPGDITGGKPIVVLVDGGTASASEIVAGALQDNRRARIEGSLTFGKGSVQTVIPLDDGKDGALHLTTARYYTPSGRSIQTTGIVPDIDVADSSADANAFDGLLGREADLPNHLAAEGPPPRTPAAPVRPDPKKKYADFQLSYAMTLLDATPGAAHVRPGPSRKER